MEEKADDNLKRLIAQIEVEQGLRHLKDILPQCLDLQDVIAKLMYNFYSSLRKEGFTKSQAIEIIQSHGTGINNSMNGE
ncbi:MAG: hypothetical protein ACE5KZ_09990 [Candidatus Scalinduaceae bacterium]